MVSTDQFASFQADHHPLVATEGFASPEEYCLFLMHRKAYETAALICRDKSVLDFGCNNGYGTAVLGEVASRAVGVDVSERAIETARTTVGRSGLEFCRVDGMKLPFPDASFDVITAFQVIEHLVEPGILTAELRRLLRPNGVVLITTPQAGIRLDPGMRPWNEFHVREYRAEELREELRATFPIVWIWGLFAIESLYAIEYERCQRSLRLTRRSRSVGGRVRASWMTARKTAGRIAKAVLPSPIVELLRGRAQAVLPDGGQSAATGDGSGLSTLRMQLTWTTRDLSYRQTELERALDLLAVACVSPLELPAELTVNG